MKRQVIMINPQGYRINGDHPQAKLTQAIADRIRELHETGTGYKKLTQMFGVSRSAIISVVHYKTFAQTPERYKTILIEENH